MYLLKDGYIVSNNNLIKKDIYIKDGYIVDEFTDPNLKVIDCTDLVIIPGACDLHVHLREPGQTHKETIKSGTMSAAKGGVTCVCAMPNIIPYPDSLEGLKVELEAIKKDSVVKVYPYGCITKGQKGKELADINDLNNYVCGFSDDGVGVDDMTLMDEACKLVKANDSIILSHAEVGNLKYTRCGEYLAVEREIKVALKEDVKYHFCHLSTKESLDLVREAKKRSNKITCEITPHHLVLTEDDINNNPNFKMNPPLRPLSDKEACIKALVDGTCDAIATDHAPHSKEEKSLPYEKALNGIIGLETFIPLIYTYFVKTNIITFDRMLDLIAHNPRKILGVKDVKVEKGYIADLAVLDINNYYEYKEEEILSKGKNSPFIGSKLTGVNMYTFVVGNLVYERK